MYYQVSFFNDITDNKPKTDSLTWQQLCELTGKPDIRRQKDGRLISGANFTIEIERTIKDTGEVVRGIWRDKKCVSEISILKLDYDHAPPMEKGLTAWQAYRHLAYTTFNHNTPEKGNAYRVIIPLAEPIPAADYPALWQWAFEQSGRLIDLKCKDTSRIVYLPSCPPERQEFFQFTKYDGAALDWRLLNLSEYREKPKAKPKAKPNRDARDILAKYVGIALGNEIISVSNASDGERNDTLNRAAFSLGTLCGAQWASAYITRAECENSLLGAALAAGLARSEAESTIKSGLDAGEKEPREKPEGNTQHNRTANSNTSNEGQGQQAGDTEKPIKALSMPEFIGLDIPEQVPVIFPIINTHSISMIHAPPGVGKTLLCTDLCFAVATGLPALKWTVPQKRRVLIVDGEMPRAMLKKRYIELLERHQLPATDYFNILSFEDFEHLDDGINLSKPECQAIVEKCIAETGAEMLLLDNLDSLFLADENKQSDLMSGKAWMKSLRGRGLAVLVVHHSNKSGGYSGHNALARNPDLVFSLRRPDNYEQAEGAVFDVVFEKTRGIWGEAVEPFTATLTPGGWELKASARSAKGLLAEIVEAIYSGETTLNAITDYIGGDDTIKLKNSIKMALKRYKKDPYPITHAGEDWIISAVGGGVYNLVVPSVPFVPSVPSVPCTPA
jgi:hypothetical protein